MPCRSAVVSCPGAASLAADARLHRRPDARLPPARPQPGLCHARHGRHLHAGRHADGARRAARRRQRAGCGGRRLRRAVRDRAAIHRHRRRLLLPLRAGRHREGDRAERLGPRPRGGHDRLVRAARHRPRMDNTSAHSVTVPGAVNAWETLLAAHGRKGLDELLQPAIRFAADGWPVHDKVAWDWARLEDKLRKNGAHAFLPGGHAPARRRPVPQPALAETLRAIAAARRPRLLRRSGRRRHRRHAARPRRPAHRGGFRRRPAQRGIRRADHAQLARLRCLPVPAERSGPGRADDPRHSRGYRDGAGRAAQRASAATGISRRRGWPIATATPSSPTRRRRMCRSRSCSTPPISPHCAR